MSQAPEARGGTDWLRADFDGKPVYFWVLLSAAIAVVILGFGALWGEDLREDTMAATGGMDGANAAAGMQMAGDDDIPRFPPVFGYYDGEEIWFAHTEASDAQVADMLTMMMGSPVLVVSSLAEVPPDARASAYVFQNGVKPEDVPAGPFGFQPDVFDSAPGDEGYTPLREVVLVRWQDGAEPRELRSAQEVAQAEAAGEVALERSGVVVNMPFLRWPGGER
jgi:hypothetical protein